MSEQEATATCNKPPCNCGHAYANSGDDGKAHTYGICLGAGVTKTGRLTSKANCLCQGYEPIGADVDPDYEAAVADLRPVFGRRPS